MLGRKCNDHNWSANTLSAHGRAFMMVLIIISLFFSISYIIPFDWVEEDLPFLFSIYNFIRYTAAKCASTKIQIAFKLIIYCPWIINERRSTAMELFVVVDTVSVWRVTVITAYSAWELLFSTLAFCIPHVCPVFHGTKSAQQIQDHHCRCNRRD